MPFIKKSDQQGIQPAHDAQKVFVGRTNELRFFTERILKPEDPTYNIVSIYGDGGVGKSTLLSRFVEEANLPGYKEYCLLAVVDERQATVASMMEKFAEQLHMRNEFKRALIQYKDAVHKLQSEQETMQDAVLQSAPDFAGAVVEGVPFVGPLLREGMKFTASHLISQYQVGMARQESEHLSDPIRHLTRAFVLELNHLAETPVALGKGWGKRRRRIILCFDTFEQLAIEVAPWLLDHFLPADISNSIVLLTAGRISIEQSTPNDPKRWLPYRDEHVIHAISLSSFTEEETYAYLEQRGITDPARIYRIWQLSRGLPLYLSLLTSDAHHEVDPTADVVANFLRWIPEHESTKRRLVLDAALFSRPFNQDELSALSYIAEHERAPLYHWLVRQPFVRRSLLDGRYSYHELAEDLFSRHLFQESPNACYATRRALADYYRSCLKDMSLPRGEEIDHTTEWLNVTVALAQQLLLLPDSASHVAAIEQLLHAYIVTKQDEEITRVLRDLFQEHLYNQANADGRQSARILLQYVEAEPMSQEFLVAANNLLRKVTTEAHFSPTLLASIYGNRGVTYRNLNDPQKAIADFNQAVALNPHYAWAYGNRGITYRSLKQYDDALRDFNQALQLDDTMDWVYVGRGEVYRHVKSYQHALADFDRAIALDPGYAQAYASRGRVYRYLKKYERALQDFDHALEIDPEIIWAYGQRGEVHRFMGQYKRAIGDYDKAIELADATGYFWAYGSRGLAYYFLGDFDRAMADFNLAITLSPSPTYAWGYAERGRLYRHLRKYNEALADFNRALEIDPDYAWAYSHRGMTYASLGDYESALADCDRSLALDPAQAGFYGRRGSIYLYLGDLERASVDYGRNCEMLPSDLRACWTEVWIDMCKQRADLSVADRLEQIAARQPQDYFAYVCRGVAMWLRGQRTTAITEIAEACTMRPGMWDAFFWKSMCNFSVGDAGAIDALRRALSHNMPPILLTPLRWLEQEQPAVYKEHVAPILAEYNI